MTNSDANALSPRQNLAESTGLPRSVLMGVGAPGSGGHSFFLNLKQALARYGVTVHALATSTSPETRGASLETTEAEFVLRYGEPRAGAESLLELVESLDLDVFMPSNNPLMTAVLPHLPLRTMALPVCNAIVNSAYHFATRHVEHAPLIVVLSPRQRFDLMLKWRVPHSRIRLVPHGTEIPEELLALAPAARATSVYVGRLERAKGAHFLPDIVEMALAANPDFRLEILGDGSYRRTLEQRLDQKNLTAHVVFHGNASLKEVTSTLSRAALLINPTQHDGFGLVTIEAMAHGAVPIVSRIRGVTTSIVKHGTSGLLCGRRSAAAFGKAVVSLQAQPDTFSRMRNNAYARARAEFSLNAMALRYLQVFRELRENSEFRRWRRVPLSQFAPHQRYAPNFFEKLVHKIL